MCVGGGGGGNQGGQSGLEQRVGSMCLTRIYTVSVCVLLPAASGFGSGTD